MLSGLPIVTADHPHLISFIDEGKCGLAIKADDAHAHAEAIRYLYENQKETKIMGENGRNLVLSKYIWETEEKNLFDFYSQVLSGIFRRV